MKFSSPLLVRPNAKQIPITLALSAVLCALLLYLALTAAIGGDIPDVIGMLLLFCACVYHMYTLKKHIRRNVTALIYSVFAIAAAKSAVNVLTFFSSGVFDWKTVLTLLFETLFWTLFVICTARTVCGRYKLILPLLFLFFAFFYTFLKFSLRELVPLLSQILLLLALWLPIDAIAFTSLIVNDDEH